MTRAAEIRASEQMRDRIADMLLREGEVRKRQSAGRSKGKLLHAIERHVRMLPGLPAAALIYQPAPETRQP